mgnify:CR=1 FL=1|jgi:hypothetical protein
MTFEEHCEESVRLFGEPFEEVHLWLDEFAGTEEYGMRHRKKRHHEAGIEESVAQFGEEVREAARQHVISDLKQEGWTDSDPFPRDEREYVKMGLF